MLLLLGVILLATPVSLKDLLPTDYAGQFAAPSHWGQDQREDSLGFRVAAGLSEYLTVHIRQLILPVGGGETETAFFTRRGLAFVPPLFGLAISGVILLGFVRWLSGEPLSIPVLFALLFLAIMIIWPWRGPRYLYPIQPQLFLALLLGSAALAGPLARRLNRRAAALPFLLAVFCLGTLALYAILSFQRDDSRLHTGDLQDRTAWLSTHTDPTSVILSEQPYIDYLYGQRKTVPYGTLSPGQLDDYLTQYRVTHILIAPRLEWEPVHDPTYSPASLALQKVLRSQTLDGRFSLVHDSSLEGVYVYQVNLNTNTR
jgi:hypothetical protein